MPYPNAHSRLTWGGGAFSNNEIWQCGVRLSGTTPPDAARITAWTTALTAYMTTVQSTHVLEWWKWAPIGTDGKYLDTPALVEAELHVVGSAATIANAPGQLSACVTLRSDKKRGSASVGRFYPPPQAMNITADGVLVASKRDEFATAAKSLINALNAGSTGGELEVSLCSPGGKKTQPDQRKVISVAVGRVIDTQRRRRSALPEEAVTVPL